MEIWSSSAARSDNLHEGVARRNRLILSETPNDGAGFGGRSPSIHRMPTLLERAPKEHLDMGKQTYIHAAENIWAIDF